MPPFLVKALLEQAAAQGSRSTVLRPLGWLLLICVTASICGPEMHAPNWLMILFGGIDAITVLTYIAAYCYCLVKDREALRTETYSIRKLAIERGLMGDSLSGIFSATSNEQMKAIGDSSKTKQVEGEQ